MTLGGFSKAFTKIFNEQDGTEQKLYKKQVEFLNLLRPEEDIVTVVKARQTGFSTCIQAKSVHRAYFGKVPEILITSAGQNQSMRVLRKIKQFFRTMPEFMRVEFVKDTETQITLSNGTSIYSLPANADTCRGFTGDVFLDEYGVQKRREGDELWEALLPCTAKGYNLIAVSTPKGKNNMFYDLCYNYSNKDPETGEFKTPRPKRVIEIPWWDVPHIAAVIDKFKEGMHPKQFAQEFECQFMDDAEYSLFTYDFLMEHVVDQRDNSLKLYDVSCCAMDSAVLPTEYKVVNEIKEKYPKGVYVGWDIAITGDGSIATVFGITADDVWELIAYKKFDKGTDLTVQIPFVSRMCQMFEAKRLTFDATGGLGLAANDLLKQSPSRNILNPFKFTPQSKVQEYSELHMKMAREEIRMPEIKECITEFTILGVNPVTGRIAAMGGKHQHDDWPSSFLCAYAGRKSGLIQSGFSFV